ncbi:AmmeMemoRadiSam system protein A [Acidiplasma aeolicum]|jgi:AmmeMemoRadiSam system protein A
MEIEKDSFLESLTEDDGKLLMDIALNALKKHFGLEYKFPAIPEKFKTNAGVFVTINEEKNLRGCIGYIFSIKPLAEAVKEMAVAAATEDPRFRPVTLSEFNKIEIEITVLGKLQRINYTDIDKIDLGVHGIYVKNGFYSGVLLPQVAIEYGFNKQQFLEETCRKAG